MSKALVCCDRSLVIIIIWAGGVESVRDCFISSSSRIRVLLDDDGGGGGGCCSSSRKIFDVIFFFFSVLLSCANVIVVSFKREEETTNEELTSRGVGIGRVGVCRLSCSVKFELTGAGLADFS